MAIGDTVNGLSDSDFDDEPKGLVVDGLSDSDFDDTRDIRPLAKQRLDRLKAGGSLPETSGPVGQLTPELNTVFDAVAGANDKLDQFAQGQVDTKRRLQQEREAALRHGNITGQDPRLAAIPTSKPRSGLESIFDRRPTPEGYNPEQDKPNALTAIAATVRAALGGAGAISPDATPIARARLRPTAPQVEPGGGVRLPPQAEPAPPIPMRMPPDLRSKAAERLAALRAQEPQAPNVQPLFAGKGLGEAPETTYFAPGDTLLGRASASAPGQAYRGASEWMHGASADFGRWATDDTQHSALARLIDAGQRSDSDLAQLAAGVTRGGVQAASEIAPTIAEFAALNVVVPGAAAPFVHAGTAAYFTKDGVEMLTQAAKDAPGVLERGDPDEVGRALVNTAAGAGMAFGGLGARGHVRDALWLREHPEFSREAPGVQAEAAHYTSSLGAAERAVASTPPRAFSPDMVQMAQAADEGRPAILPRPTADLPEGFEPLPPVEGPPAPLTLRDRLAMQGMRGQAHPIMPVEGQGAGPFPVPPDVRAQAGALPADLRRVDPQVADTLATILTGEEAPTLPVRPPTPQPGLSWQERQAQERGEPVPPPPPPGPIQRPPRQSAPEIRPDQTFQALQEARRRGMDPGDILNRILDEADLASRVAVQREVGSESELGAQLLRAERIANDATQSAKKRKAAATKAEQLRAQLGGVDAGGPPVQPPPGASGPAELPPAGSAPAEAAPEPVGRPAVAPAEERLAPEPKEQLDAQLAAVGEGTKPGVFYPVQNAHEVPDTPAGLARVNGEQGSLIFDPKRVPVEKAQRAVDTGENLHEVIGMSGPREGDVAVTTRDARGVPITDEQTADPQRAVAAATPPEGGSVEVRPLADVVEERRGGAGRPAVPENDAERGFTFLGNVSKRLGPGKPGISVHPSGEAVYVVERNAGGQIVNAAEVMDGGVMMVAGGPRLWGDRSVPSVGGVMREVKRRGWATHDLSGNYTDAGWEMAKTHSEKTGEKLPYKYDEFDPLDAFEDYYQPRDDDPYWQTHPLKPPPLADVVEKRKVASDREDLARPPSEVGVGQEPIQAKPLARGGEEAPSTSRDVQAQGGPGGVLPARERLVREAKTAGMGTPEQVDAVAQVWDARAKQWARETGQSVGQFFQKFFGGVKKGGAPKGSLKQGEAPVFYSKLRRVVEGMKSPVTPEQLRGYLKAQGVKAEEMEWTNLDSALEGKRLVRPEELLKHLDTNEVKLEEVHKGGNDYAEAESEFLDARDRLAAARERLRDYTAPLGPKDEYRHPDEKARRLADLQRADEKARRLADFRRANEEFEKAKTKLEMAGPPEGATKYGQYQVPGGEEGYFELLLTLPRRTREVVVDNPRAPVEVRQNIYGDGKWRLVDRTGEWSGESYHSRETAEAALREARTRGTATAKVTDPSYQSQHWDEEGVVVHVRANPRDGGKTLHLEEIQSDWHQQGKRQGYASGARPAWEAWADKAGMARDSVSYSRLELAGAPPEVLDSFRRDGNARGWGGVGELPPDAPFKKTWPELALKRMLRYAAENGYERVTWTTGETQAERYDLSTQISKARWEPRGTAEDGRRVGLFEARDANGNRVMNDILAEDELPDHIGKELADRIIQGSNRHHEAGPVDVTLSDLDLKVGGEGMEGFYDKILPSVANRLAKKFGARVGEHTIEGDVKVHSLEVTKAMRDSVMEGQPLFQKAKGAVSFMEDGKAVIHALEQPDVSTFIHETAHVFRRTLADTDRAIAERVYGVRDGEWKRTHEERWATDFERYTMTGKAPTTALARVFEQFKQWLTDIYKSVKGAEVHPEIKALFDRMLGAEEKPTETLAERKRRMDAEIQATGDDLRSLDGLKAIVKEVDRPTKLRLLQKAIPGAGPRTKQWAYDELERVRSEERTEAPVDLAPTPERRANVRADELVTKVLGENIGAQRRQAATFAIDELVAGRPATKGVFTLPEENAVRAELGLPARKLAVKKGGVAVAPLPGAKSLGAGAGGNDMTSPLGHGFLGRAIDSAKAVGRGVVQGVAKFRGKETPGASVDIGDPVDANPTPRGVPNTLPDSVTTTGGARRNISNLAEARNLFGGGQQNTINVESPEAAAALRMAAVHTAAARTVHQETMKKMEGLAKDGLRKQGLKGDELVAAARDRVYDTLRWLSGSNQEGLHQRWIDLKEAAGKLNDRDFLSAARDSEIKTPIEALSQKKWLFEDYADEKLATALAKAVKEKNAKRAREIVDDAYGRAIEAHREQTFSDPNATMDSIEAEPWLGPMLEAWDNGTGKLLEQVHRSNEGIFRQEKYLGRAKRYFPGIEAEAPTKAGGIRRPEHANQTNPDNKFATGISETGYSIAPEDIIHSASRSLFVNGRAAAEQALLDAGVSYDLPPGAEHPKTMLYKGREVEAKVEPTQTLWRMRRDGKLEQAVDLKYRVYPAQVHREMSPIFAPGVHDPHTFLKRVVDNINSAQMAGLTDLSAHVTNQILTLFNNATPIFMYAHKKASSAEQGNYVGNLLKAMWADLDSPEVQARMREMAMNGQLHPATGASTFYTDQADFLGIHDAVKPFGREWLNVFPVDPKTGKRSLRPLPADLGPLLTGTGRGMDLALDTRIRVLLDQVGEHIFESTNPGKKWADNPQLRFDFTKQLGIYHRGLEGRLIEFMKDVPIFGRLAPFATAGTTFNRNGIAALFGGTFEMPVGEGAKAQVLNRYRAYGVAAGIAAPVATWVLLYKQHTGKYPWEDERSKFMQIPINDETRKSAFGRQLWGDDMTKTAYLNLGKYTPFTRGLRVTGARNFNPLDKAKEGLETKDRALMAFTDVINGWLHPWTGPAVGMASVASSGFEPRFQYSPKAGRPALSPAYRGKWSPGKNLKASVLHGNPMVANYHRAKLEDRTTFGSVVDSVASGLLQNSRTPASKLEKLLAKRTPLVTKEMSDEKLAEYDYIRKTTAALRHGEDKEKVMADLREKVKAGFIGEGKAKGVVEAAAMPDWYDDFEGANVEDAADAWLVATPEQRKRLGGVMGEKVKRWRGLATQKNLSKADRDRIRAKIEKAAAAR